MSTQTKKYLRSRPELIFVGTVIFVALSLALIYLIDVRDSFEIRQQLFGGESVPFFWGYWYKAVVESIFQWGMLFLVMYLFFMSAHGALKKADLRAFRFCRLMGFGALLMFLEDVFNFRHIARDIMAVHRGGNTYDLVGTAFELGYFAAIASTLIYAVWRYRDVYWDHIKSVVFLALGFLFYGIAVGSSWAGSAFQSQLDEDLYTRSGRLIMDRLFRSDPETSAIIDEINQFLAGETLYTGEPVSPLEYYFMDYVYEESMEVLGASALLVAALTIYSRIHRSPSDNGQS